MAVREASLSVYLFPLGLKNETHRNRRGECTVTWETYSTKKSCPFTQTLYTPHPTLGSNILLPYFLTSVCKSPVQRYILGVDDGVSCLYIWHFRNKLTEVCGTAAVRPQVQPNNGCKIPFKRSGAMFLALIFHPSMYLFDFLDCLFKAASQAKVSPEILK